jgi:hypothetical protein
MEIITHSAQIRVSDGKGSCGANINRRSSGHVAELHFWGDQVYLARRKGDPSPRILIMPREEWKRDLESEDFEIIGKLSDIANDQGEARPHSITSAEAPDYISSQLEPPVIKKNAEFTSSELLMKMNEIIEEYPHQGNFADDGRYTYPDRWNALLKYIKEKQ